MAQNPPYIPPPDSLAGPWSDNFNALLTANPTDYGLVAGDAVAADAVIVPWLAALATATNPSTRTPVSVAAKDDARAAMEAVVRPLAVAISQNPSVSNGLKTGIGVTPRIVTRTRNSVVAIETLLTGAPVGATIMDFRATDPATPFSKARPLGALAWELEIDKERTGTPGTWDANTRVVVTRPIYRLDTTGLAAPSYRARARWTGAILPGGALNAGPWSDYIFFGIV